MDKWTEEETLEIRKELSLIRLLSTYKSTMSVFNKMDKITQEEADMDAHEFMDFAEKLMEDVQKSIDENEDWWMKNWPQGTVRL